MKKAFLIFLMLILPWQAMAAMERNLGHLSGSRHGSEFGMKHMVEHANHVLHHHDDDGATHLDNSEKSVHHLTDYDQAGSMNLLFPALSASASQAVPRFPPGFRPDRFRTRSVLPLLRPPRLPA